MRGPGRTAGLVGAVVILALAPGGAVAGQTLLSDTFSGATTSSPVLAEPNPTTPSTGLPCLTAGADTHSQPVPGCDIIVIGRPLVDPVGSGVLRLTNGATSEASSLVYNGTFPTSAGLDVTFDAYQYQGGGDGLSFDLGVAPPIPTQGGGAGGALGYKGFPFGYLGFGFDVFGNYSNVGTDGTGCTDPSWASFGAGHNGNQLVVRGPGNGPAGYCLLAGTQALIPNPVTVNKISLSGADRVSAKRAVHIQIDPNAGTYAIGIDPAGGTNYIPILSGPLPSAYVSPATGTSITGVPPRLTFAFSAATGGVAGIQEISNVVVSTLTGAVPVLSLAATDVSGGSIKPGSAVTYRLIPGVAGASPAPEIEPTTMVLTDPLPAGETLAGAPSGTGWNCSASTAARVSCTNTATATVRRGAQLPSVSVPVTVSPSATSAITNTASLVSADAAGQVSASDTVQIVLPPPSVIPVGTTTSVVCSPGTVLIGAVSTCTAIVSDRAGSSTPTGTVQFTSTAGQFANGGSCTLAPVAGRVGAASCEVAFKATGSGTVSASYSRDPGHLASDSATGVATAPVAGKTATVQVTRGLVLIHLPGHSGYHLLSGGAFSVPVGATIDALKGSVALDTAGDNLSASNPHHVIDTGTFGEGLFTVKQTATAEQEKARSTELVLETPPGAVVHAACHRTGPAGKGVVRALNGTVKGVYNVVGAASTMSMDNGAFVVQDRCDGTLTKVTRGRATVRYRRRVGRRTRTVSRRLHAGQVLLAKERFLSDTLATG